jgi:hypothetical protein
MAADLGAVYVKAPAVPRGVTWGDVIEVAGTYVVLALVAWVALPLSRHRPGRAGSFAPSFPHLLLFVASVTYALGRGMHAAGNSIHDMMGREGMQDPWRLAYFWDECAGHVPVDVGRILFVTGLCLMERERGREGGSPTDGVSLAGTRGAARLISIAGAVAYGFIYFATAVEGQTVFLALPFSVALAVWGLLAGRRRTAGGPAAPVRVFFTTSALISVLLFLVYGIWQRGFPEFTRAGIL